MAVSVTISPNCDLANQVTTVVGKLSTINGLWVKFFSDNSDYTCYKKIDMVTDGKVKAQSIAIRLKTELGELENFFDDFGSEIIRIRHDDLLSEDNHELIREYVEHAVRDIIPYSDLA